MQPVIVHDWTLSESEARKMQASLATKVITTDYFDEIRLVAGTDVAYSKESCKLVAAVVILDAGTLDIVETVTTESVAQFPYIPGLFSFRELPPLIEAISKLKTAPDLFICDGQGIAHPRRFGLASHLGLIFDIPTIGCGKNLLIGDYDEVGITRGENRPIMNKGEIIGSALRTQTGVNPIYISSGHRISLKTSCDWIMRLTPKYRLPETTRIADQLVKSTLNGRPLKYQ